MYQDFEQSVQNLRSWMDTVETNLQRTLSPTAFNANEVRANQHTVMV